MKGKNEMQVWEIKKGVEFLKRIGIKQGQTILDFGAGVGHYTIPASIVAGDEGMVYSIEKDDGSLKILNMKIKSLKINNIKVIKNSPEPRLEFSDASIDVVLLYDVLHYFTLDDRKILYGEVYRVLKPDALLSVYPKHVIEDSPSYEFENLHIEDVRKEIEDSHFLFFKKYCGIISHDDYLNYGCVLNFKKI